MKTPLKDEVDKVRFQTADGQDGDMLVGDFEYRQWKYVVTDRHPSNVPNTGIFTPTRYVKAVHPTLKQKLDTALEGLKAEYQAKKAKLMQQRQALNALKKDLT